MTDFWLRFLLSGQIVLLLGGVLFAVAFLIYPKPDAVLRERRKKLCIVVIATGLGIFLYILHIAHILYYLWFLR